MFLGNIFQIIELEIFINNYVDVTYIKMILFVSNKSFQFYQFSNLTHKCI